MTLNEIQQRIKPWMLPFAMLCGILFHNYIEIIGWIVPYLIFTMLTITFCKVRLSDFGFSPMMWMMLAVQILGAVLVFVLIRPLSLEVAQAIFICIICPTATAAPVVTGMLGGSVPKVATYSVLSNLSVAVLAPFLFVWVGGDTDISFFEEFKSILLRVAPIIVIPLLIGVLMEYTLPGLRHSIASVQGVSFYLWAVSLVVVVGRAVAFILTEPASAIPSMIVMALGSGVACVLLFIIGRRIGRRFDEPVTSAQALAQKNTILAIWMALTYLNPISSVGPAAYVAWQNTINSVQMYYRLKK